MDFGNNAAGISQTDVLKTDIGDAGFTKHDLNNSGSSFSSYGTAVSTDTVVTSRGHEDLIHHSNDHSTLPIMEDDGSALLVTAAPETGESSEVTGDRGMVSDPSEQTITLSLDAATQYLLQQQGITTQAIEMDDGTYQLFEQPVIQVQREDGTLEAQTLHVEVLQALQGELVQQLQPSLDAGYPLVEQDEEEETAVAEADEVHIVKASDSDGIARQDQEEPEDSASQESDDTTKLLKREIEDMQQTQDGGMGGKSAVGTSPDKDKPQTDGLEKTPSQKDADFTSPIPLSNQTVITVNGKKCVLSYDAKTQQVCAYPIKTKTGKRRGRPRLTEAEKVAARQRKMQMQMEQASSTVITGAPLEKSSAAETLLELSNTGSGGIRRSGRARKKAKLLDDFEELEDSEEDDGPAFEDNHEKDPDISLELPEAKRKRLMAPKKDLLPTLSGATLPGFSTPGVTPNVKRGRGRPRRYPLPGQQNPPKSIPAVMLPSADGQTLVMAPIQDLQNLQQIRRQLPQLVPKPPDHTSDPASLTTVQGEGPDAQNLVLNCSDGDPLPLDASGVLDSNNMIPQALQGDSIPLVGDTADSSDQGDGLDTSPSSLLNLMATSTSGSDKTKQDGADSQPQPTVIQIPDNLLASLGFKKDPVKIGLKASERELEKLKCPKCDFQCYYAQQYRNHIATHGDDIQKCKCCSFLTLDPEELLQHFKENHPRCICSECGYMAEHAYIIKRHMMRHDVKSCTCNICGKVYKDMYILKMHIKMVHMPAEVLFECDVCSKKFTRKAHLKRHMRTHEPEKPFKCSLCDYRGCERSDISKHMLIHQEPKHACERCGKTFRHIKNKELHVKRHYGQRDYKCGVCDFFGYTFTDIRKHIERKHQDIKTLICDKCGKHFRNEMALKEHLQTCNVMMIEQVLAIPTSGGRTSQATIRIPTHHLGSLGGVVALDPSGTAGMTTEAGAGVGEDGVSGQGVSIMVTSAAGEQHLGLVQTQSIEEEEEEEEEELEEEEEDQEVRGEGHSMHLIEGAIMKPGVEGVNHVLASHGNPGLPETHMLEQGEHYVTTSSGIHLISSSVLPANPANMIAMAGDEPHSQQAVDSALASKTEASLSQRGEVELPSNQHLIVMDGGHGAAGKSQILANIEEWSAAAEVASFNNTIDSSAGQNQLSAS